MPKPTTHAELCAPAQTANLAWCAQWPNHCRECEGVGLTGERDEDGACYPCSCTEIGHCPRCGCYGGDQEFLLGPCPTCGWDYNDWPPPYGCWCDEAVEAAMEAGHAALLGDW